MNTGNILSNVINFLIVALIFIGVLAITFKITLRNYNVKPSYGFKGKHHSDEFRQKVSERNKTRIVSEETRNKITVSIKNRYKNHDNPMKGKHHSEESKKLMSINSMGKKHTPETLEKMSKANKGKKRKFEPN